MECLLHKTITLYKLCLNKVILIITINIFISSWTGGDLPNTVYILIYMCYIFGTLDFSKFFTLCHHFSLKISNYFYLIHFQEREILKVKSKVGLESEIIRLIKFPKNGKYSYKHCNFLKGMFKESFLNYSLHKNKCTKYIDRKNQDKNKTNCICQDHSSIVYFQWHKMCVQ